MKDLLKLYRFSQIYGFSRTINKALGRLRLKNIAKVYFFKKNRNISIIGNGQFAFSTIAYFLAKEKGNVFLDCYDINKINQNSISKYYKFLSQSKSYFELLSNPNLEFLYIASNHVTHTKYAIEAMKIGVKNIYIEKPISVTHEQFSDLGAWRLLTKANIYSGYNRPFSKAFKILEKKIKQVCTNENSPFTISFFISGHKISADHWYRNPEEGTRICGNLGHWIDSTINILSWRSLPETIEIDITYSNLNEIDDNLVINFKTDKNDLVSILLTARTEPFEGINESINLQFNSIISKIDDFRNMVIWNDEKLEKYKFYPKDVGHKSAVLQPFNHIKRDWREIEISTLIMLNITNMVKERKVKGIFIVSKELLNLNKTVTEKVKYLSKNNLKY
jgi:predicted dehydrogenase